MIAKTSKKLTIVNRGYFDGEFEVRTKWDGEILGKIKVIYSNFWEENSAQVSIPDGINAIYLTFKGYGAGQLKSIKL